MADAADEAVAKGSAGPNEAYVRASGTWALLAVVILALLTIAAILMVWKPGN
jgi:hypothetical protein